MDVTSAREEIKTAIQFELSQLFAPVLTAAVLEVMIGSCCNRLIRPWGKWFGACSE